jgi:hypothetical protein
MSSFGCVLSEHQIIGISKGIREAQRIKDTGRAQALINFLDQVWSIHLYMREQLKVFFIRR